MLWVAYGEDGLPDGVFDSARALAEHLGIDRSSIYRMLQRDDPQIARIRDVDEEDEEVAT